MRWRFYLVVVLGLFVVMSCDQQPIEPPTADTVSQTTPSYAGATVFRGDFGCAVLDGDGYWYPPEFTYCGTEVATFSKNGNAIVVVQKTGVYNPTGEVVKWDAWNPPQILLDFYELEEPPAPCFVLGTDGGSLFTVKWSAKVTPGGVATFMCHYAKKWEYTFPE